jgi:hypothetical protein
MKFPTDREMIWTTTLVLVIAVGLLNGLKKENKFLETTASAFVGASLGVSLNKQAGRNG